MKALSPAGVPVCQGRVGGLHSFPWLSRASLEGEEDGSAQGFLLLGHPGVPSGLLKGPASPFLVLERGGMAGAWLAVEGKLAYL